MSVSVIVITRDEAPRLALALASLEAARRAGTEVIVVDDGSRDATPAILDDAAARAPIERVTHATARGRSAARNAGAARASGEILMFLDGDVLLGPDSIDKHIAIHRTQPTCIGRGEQYHLRCTRLFKDPRSGVAMPGQEQRVARMSTAELAQNLVTEAQVRDDFAAIVRRAEVGIYPGSAPRLLAEVELAGLRANPDSPIAWVAACSNNLSVPRALFDEVGGFDPALSINEHRELAFRLVQHGAAMHVAEGARSYHLTHRTGWRDPLDDTEWERQFWARHPSRAVALLAVFWRSLARDPLIPPEAQIASLADFERAARGDHPFDFMALRRTHPKLGALPGSA